MVTRSRWGWRSTLALLWLLQACYDHSYTQAIKQRREAAEAAKGAEVTAGGGLSRPIQYEGKVRVYASPEYRANRSGWVKRITDLVDSTGPVLGPAFAIRLEVVDTFPWEPKCDQTDLGSCVRELAEHDPGDDVDWVVGLIGLQPKFTATFEELGMALTPSKHFVMRDLYDAGERKQINEVFSSMTQAKRSEIYRRRQEHKRLVVFLHEWAHTLGALHVRDDMFILYPAYDDEMSIFAEDNLRLVDAALLDRFPPSPDPTHLREYLVANDSPVWYPGERDQLLAWIGASPRGAGPGGGPRASGHGLVVPGDTKQLLTGVQPADQGRYDEAVAHERREEFDDAWDKLAPLVSAYPNNYPIQHFGCGLAMYVGAPEAGDACRRSIELLDPEFDPSR